MTRLRQDGRGSAALEFALCFPAILLFVFGLFAVYSLVSSWRAIDVGIEKALRYAAVHGGAGAGPVTTAYNNAARTIWRTVGTASTVTVTPSTYKAGDVVQVSVSYVWAAPARLRGSLANPLFNGVTLTAAGSMRVVN